MTLQQILDNARQRMGIAELKPMQADIAGATATRLRLCAPTGAGKTLAYTIYALTRMSAPGKGVQTLVIAPSRELVLQIASVIKPLATGYKTVALYGGHNMADEKNSLTPTPDIIVATPGRLLDHINRRQADISGVSVLVLDEYDKCVELGFEPDMKRIVRAIRSPKFIVMCSATAASALPGYLPADGWKLYDYGSDVSRARLAVVEVPSPDKDKAETLADLLAAIAPAKSIVFVNHRESAERLHTFLRKAGIPAALYHGGLEQHDRLTAVQLLENGTVDTLVATDLAARGLDIDSLDAVVHYHMPTSPEAWTHRNGRTARNGASGTAYVITSSSDNIPDEVNPSRSFNPPVRTSAPKPPAFATLHFSAGRKEKISKADILGFLVANTPLEAAQIGRIMVNDHDALAAVPAPTAPDTLAAAQTARLKGKKVRITRLYP